MEPQVACAVNTLHKISKWWTALTAGSLAGYSGLLASNDFENAFQRRLSDNTRYCRLVVKKHFMQQVAEQIALWGSAFRSQGPGTFSQSWAFVPCFTEI
jgi:hypothetical protein